MRKDHTSPIWVCVLILVIIGVLGFAPEARAEKKIVFSKITDPVDFEEAVRYWHGELQPEDYDNERDFGGQNSWPATKTVEDYVRHYIRIGKADINDDGIDELFYVQQDTRFCGSAGCQSVILERWNGKWSLICGTELDKSVAIIDWVSEGGYRELRARYAIYWRDGICYTDEPRTPETENTPPRGERHWKPLK